MARGIRFYVDTSVFGGAFDAEFKIPSLLFFEQVRRREIAIVISAIVSRELDDAPSGVRSLFDEMLGYADVIPVTPEALSLRQAYINADVLTPKWLDDALHVALAAESACDGIVSWNFKHIVHYQKIPRYNAVTTLEGYQSIMIYSPLEVINYGKAADAI
jgi:hypothetical protein